MRPLQTLLWGSLPGAALEEGGHDQLCKTIKKAGGAEQYNANQNYTEAVSVAARSAPRTPRAGVLLCRRPSIGRRRRVSCGVFLSWNGGVRARVVLAEEAKILGRSGGEQLDGDALKKVGGGTLWFV